MIVRIPINVECYAGGRGAETPRALHLEGRHREVESVLDRWYEGGVEPGRPAVEYFKLRTGDDELLIVRYESDSHAWFLVSESSQDTSS